MQRPTIGVFHRASTGYYFGGLLSGIDQAARRMGARLLAVQTVDAIPDAFATQRADPPPLAHFPLWQLPATAAVDAWIVLHESLTGEEIARLHQTGRPLVTIAVHTPYGPTVSADSAGGAAAAVGHLIEHGHTRIAFAGSVSQEDSRLRYEGYLRGMRERGLEPDPALFTETSPVWETAADDVMRMLLRDGHLTCTALVADSDMLCLEIIPRLLAAGYRCPQDLAITGFDNTEQGQLHAPPLASVEQPLERMAARAVELALAQVRGEPVAPERVLLPTTFLPRGTCGCSAARHVPRELRMEDDWRPWMAHALVALVISPRALDPQTDPRSIWPGVDTIVQAVADLLDGGDGPAPSVMAAAWAEAVELNDDIEALSAAMSLLERSARSLIERRRAGAAGPGQDCDDMFRFATFVQRAHLDLLRARDNARRDTIQRLETFNWVNGEVNLALLSAAPGVARSLSWLAPTPTRRACLGLWDVRDGQPRLQIVGTFTRDGDLGLPQEPVPLAQFPPAELFGAWPDAHAIGMVVPVRCGRAWGLLALYGPPDIRMMMFYRLESMGQWAHELGAALDREALLLSLEESQRAAEAANQLKTQFLTNMSHELRTPLNAIINFTMFMDKERYGALNERQRQLQQRVAANAEHLLGLINDILDISKIEAGRLDLFCEPTNLVPILQGVMSTTIGLTRDKVLALDLDIADDLPTVFVDKQRVRQVLLNLLSNAAKFTEQGGITLRASPTPDGMVQVSVQDTGIGIAPEQQHLVFEEFRQIDGKLTRQHQGTGLGMPISKRLIELQGGTMWLESTPDIGTTFFFTVPVFQAILRPAAPAGDARNLVVVVDDDAASQQILHDHLNDAGYHAHVIGDSRQAHTAIAQLQPQLVVLDVLMPHLDGWAVLAQLRSDPATSHIPVVLCSMVDEQRLGLALGASDYLVKPVRAEPLLEIVRQWVGHTQSVLVIDDQPDSRLIIRAILESAHYQVREAAGGRAGLAEVQAERPSLVVLDLLMPEMDGFEVLAQLRAQPETADLPVIIVTAKDMTAQEQAWLRDRAQLALQKDQLSPVDFLRHIQSMLRKSHARA